MELDFYLKPGHESLRVEFQQAVIDYKRERKAYLRQVNYYRTTLERYAKLSQQIKEEACKASNCRKEPDDYLQDLFRDGFDVTFGAEISGFTSMAPILLENDSASHRRLSDNRPGGEISSEIRQELARLRDDLKAEPAAELYRLRMDHYYFLEYRMDSLRQDNLLGDEEFWEMRQELAEYCEELNCLRERSFSSLGSFPDGLNAESAAGLNDLWYRGIQDFEDFCGLSKALRTFELIRSPLRRQYPYEFEQIFSPKSYDGYSPPEKSCPGASGSE